MIVRIQLRRGLAADWASHNPLLAQGEVGYETDTRKWKVGNGTDNWNILPYMEGGAGGGMEQHGNEYHTPDMALDSDLAAHVAAAAPHSGHETPAGAQGKVDTHAALATGVHGVGAGTVAKVADIAVDANLSAAAQDAVGKRHDNANDPSADQKAALAGTNGAPGDANRYVTNADPRNTDARTPTAHQHDASDVNAGTLDGDRLPAMSTTKKGGVPATGTPTNLFLRDDGSWATPAGGSHDRLHAITSIADHSSTATAGKVLKADVNGLPIDASNTDAEVAAAVTASHAKQHGIASAADHTSAVTAGKMLKADANGLPAEGTNADADVADAVSKKHTQNADTDLDATFEATFEKVANKGAANGYCGLDGSGLVDGDDLPATSTTKKGAVPATGMASGLYLKDSGSFAAVVPRANGTTSSATPTPNSDTTDMYYLTAQAEAAAFGAPTGTPVNGQKLLIRILDNGTVRALSWNSGAGGYIARGQALPTTTVAGKYLYVGFVYNSVASKWDCVAASSEV